MHGSEFKDYIKGFHSLITNVEFLRCAILQKYICS